MDTQRLLATGARGVHLLFDTQTISSAFEQDAEGIRAALDRDIDEIHQTVHFLLHLPDAEAGRRFIAAQPREIQYVLVLLYFEVLDGELRQRPLTLH